MQLKVQESLSNLQNRFSSSTADRKFGTFTGVFVPTVLTILGVIMYLRLGWVVGNAGLVGAILIILLAHVVTVTTGLAVSSIATNIRVGAGGAFPLISQSLGLEVGGSVSVPLYLAQGVSIALYIIGFSSGVLSIFPNLPELPIVLMTFILILAIAYTSARFAVRVQLLILAIIVLATLLFAFFGGGLNAIAPLITMFFLLTYGTLNAVVLIEQTLGMVSFRPTLPIPRWVPLVGLLSCLFVMTLVNPVFGLIAIIFTLAIYAYLLRKKLRAPWGDVRSGLFMSLAEWAGERVSRLPGAPERT